MSEFSHLKNKLLAEQVEDQIYHYILDEALEPGAKAAMVMHLNFNRSYIKKVYDGEDPDDGTIGMAAYVNG